MQNVELRERMSLKGASYEIPNRFRDSTLIPSWEELPPIELRLLAEVREAMGGQWRWSSLSLEMWLVGRSPAMTVTEGERYHISEIARDLGVSIKNERLYPNNLK